MNILSFHLLEYFHPQVGKWKLVLLIQSSVCKMMRWPWLLWPLLFRCAWHIIRYYTGQRKHWVSAMVHLSQEWNKFRTMVLCGNKGMYAFSNIGVWFRGQGQQFYKVYRIELPNSRYWTHEYNYVATFFISSLATSQPFIGICKVNANRVSQVRRNLASLLTKSTNGNHWLGYK